MVLAGNESTREGPKEHHFRQPFIAGDVLLFFNPKKDQKKVTLKMAPRHAVVSVLTHPVSTFPFINIFNCIDRNSRAVSSSIFYCFFTLSLLCFLLFFFIPFLLVSSSYYPLKYLILSIKIIYQRY